MAGGWSWIWHCGQNSLVKSSQCGKLRSASIFVFFVLIQLSQLRRYRNRGAARNSAIREGFYLINRLVRSCLIFKTIIHDSDSGRVRKRKASKEKTLGIEPFRY